jgi:phosphoribosylformylglycinamidine cyclo-ligase
VTSSEGRLTYQSSGVDVDRGDALVERIRAFAKRTNRPGLVGGIGGFASLYSLKDALAALGEAGKMSDPLLVSGTDGVGTKLKVAFLANKHDTIGIDLVAMCVNDVLTTGAVPLFFLDYFATGHLDVDRAAAVIKGVADGCASAECALVGGETAEMPGLYQPGEYDLAGFAVGVVDRARVIDGRDVKAGDLIIGVLSRGLHSNGYSLARQALFERAGLAIDARPHELSPRSVAEELLEPTAIYTKLVRELSRAVRVKALAHITGAGIPGNVPRVLPPGVRARVERSSWKRPPIFELIQRSGNVADEEMWKTFNMGIGLVAVVTPADRDASIAAAQRAGETASVIGEIVEDAGAKEASVELV